MNPVLKLLLLIAGISVLVVGSSLPASAHERRTVGGFQFVVGWKAEPSFSDVGNAVQIFIRNPDSTPVTDVGDGLKVEVLTGTQKTSCP